MSKNLYDEAVDRECRERLERLSADTRPRWGTMSAAQMLAHCAEVQEVTNGKPLTGTPWPAKLLRGFIRRAVVGEKPFPRGTRTHPQYKMDGPRDFAAEKARLLRALDTFSATREQAPAHPLFGRMTPEERGWTMYKHLDHHFTQFGV